MSAPAPSRRAVLWGAGVMVPVASVFAAGAPDAASPDEELTAACRRDGAAPRPTVAAADPDAAVKRLAAEYIAAERAYVASYAGCDTLEEAKARVALHNALGDQAFRLAGELAAVPAVTLEGVAAKAQAVLEQIGSDEGMGSLTTTGSDLARSVMDDLAALAGRGGAA